MSEANESSSIFAAAFLKKAAKEVKK